MPFSQIIPRGEGSCGGGGAPRDSAGSGATDKNPGVGSHSLLQGIFPTQGSNLGLLHCRQMLYRLSRQGSQVSMRVAQWVKNPPAMWETWV